MRTKERENLTLVVDIPWIQVDNDGNEGNPMKVAVAETEQM